MWGPQRTALSKEDVTSPRLYGRGPTMNAWADSIASDTEGEFAVVGASMGGYCALAPATTNHSYVVLWKFKEAT